MKNPKLRFAIRLLVSGTLIALLLSRLDWAAVSTLLREVHLGPLCAGAALGVVGQFLMAERTRLVLRHWDVPLTRRAACSVTWIGQFCNNFLPGGMGGDMVKFYRVCRLHLQSRAAVLLALIADRLLALVALVALSAGALACGDRGMLRQLAAGWSPGSLSERFPAWRLALLVAAVGASFAALLAWRYRRILAEKGAAHLQSVRDALARGRRLDGSVAVAFVLAVLVHSLGMVCTWFYAWALAIPFHLGQVFLVWPVVLVAMMMPFSINGHGLREFILIYYFQRWGLVSHLPGGAGIKESVVALSLLTVLNDLLCNLPGGLLLLGGDDNPTIAPAAKVAEPAVAPVRR